jgi:hypothetical protein
MKYNFVVLIVISLLCACSQSEKKDNQAIVLKDEIKEKIAQQLVGRWIFDDYLQQIEKTKKIFGYTNYGTQFYSYNLGFDLNLENLLSDSAYIFQFNIHEGGGGCPIFFNKDKKVFESKEYEIDDLKKEPFEINQIDSNLLVFKFLKSGKKMAYRKVSDFDIELRRILFEGKYKNLKDNSDVAFFKDGKVTGIEGRHYFEVFYDFTFENMDVMAIQKDIELSSRQSYHFKINSDTLKIYNIIGSKIEDEDDLSDEQTVGDLWLTLLKQK